MSSFWRAYLRNLLVLGLVIGGTVLFAAVFYPDVLSVFSLTGEVFSLLKLWPIVILAVLAAALPRRR